MRKFINRIQDRIVGGELVDVIGGQVSDKNIKCICKDGMDDGGAELGERPVETKEQCCEVREFVRFGGNQEWMEFVLYFFGGRK